MHGGVAREDITPPPGAALQGHFGAPASRAIQRPLEVRAIVFACGDQRAALATIDVVGVTRQTTARIRQDVTRTCGIAGDNVMIVASHTHCAPATLPCMGLVPSPEWVEPLEQATVSCIARAARDTSPLTFGLGGGEVSFNRSRRPAGSADPVDRRVRVLRVDRHDGSSLATLFHYACHPTTLSGVRGVISPDYPGPARDTIDAATGGTSLFLPGCGGDLRPVLDDPDSDERIARARVLEYGRMLGQEVCRVVKNITTSESTSLHAARAELAIPFGNPPSPEKLRALADDQSDVGRLLMDPWARNVLQLMENGMVPRVRPTEMQVLRVGPLTLLGIPGEPLQAVGSALESLLQNASASGAIWPVGYANDMVGYLCTAQQYAEGGYEPGAYPFFDAPAPFQDEQRALIEGATRLLARSGQAR